jgi:hypothetical protein
MHNGINTGGTQAKLLHKIVDENLYIKENIKVII